MKNTIIWLLVTVVLIGGGVWYWQSQQVVAPVVSNIPSTTPTQMEDGVEMDPTANWKTYTNTKYGFEFKYPTGFVVTESLFHPYSDCSSPTQDQCGLSIKIESNSISGKPAFGLLVNGQPDGGLYTDESYINYKLARTSRNYLFVTGENVVSGGVIRTNGSVGGSPEFDHLQLMKASIVVNNDNYIWFGKFERAGADHSLLFKEILSTFHFTKEPPLAV